MLYMLVVLSLIILGIAITVPADTSTGRVVLHLGGILILGAGSVQLLLILQATIQFTFLIACLVESWRRDRYIQACIGSTFAIWVLGGMMGWSSVQKAEKLRRQYPMESLASRLAYESEARSTPPDALDDVLHTLMSLENNLTVRQQHSDFGRRARGLQWLHQSSVKHFIESPGFGSIRMVSRLYPDDLVTIGNRLMERETPLQYLPMGNEKVEAPAIPGKQQLDQLHLSGTLDFAFPAGYGYIQDRDHVAGFLPHQFSRRPAFSTSETWKVARIELVSLLKHKEPRVYLSDQLPQMKELRGNVPTRPMDDFESQGLPALRKGKSLVTKLAKHRIRMLGAIHAARQCRECHQVQRGALLGAFSYVIVPYDGEKQARELLSESTPKWAHD